MNRKLIVNEQLGWPEISETDSKIIIESLISNLKKCPGLKRKRTLPKRLREKNKKEEEEKINIDQEKQDNNDMGHYFKKHLRIGINSITKYIEKEPNNIMLVLVCRSCKPLTVLTRHLQVMCSIANIPAGCVHNLSASLTKFFNIKTVSAIAICKEFKTETSNENIEKFEKLIKVILDDLNTKISPILPHIKNPFRPSEIESSLVDDVNRELNNVQLNKKIITKNKKETDVELVENKDTFDADFISINKKNNYFTSFNDNNFILFQEEEEAHEDDQSNSDEEMEND